MPVGVPFRDRSRSKRRFKAKADGDWVQQQRIQLLARRDRFFGRPDYYPALGQLISDFPVDPDALQSVNTHLGRRATPTPLRLSSIPVILPMGSPIGVLGRENPSASGSECGRDALLDPCGRGGGSVCPGREPKDCRGLLAEASQLPDHQGEWPH